MVLGECTTQQQLSPLAKLMEKLVLGTLIEHLQLAEHQHGFRRIHSTTTTALHAIHDHIQRGCDHPTREQ